jgi:hypothetical protein
VSSRVAKTTRDLHITDESVQATVEYRHFVGPPVMREIAHFNCVVLRVAEHDTPSLAVIPSEARDLAYAEKASAINPPKKNALLETKNPKCGAPPAFDLFLA